MTTSLGVGLKYGMNGDIFFTVEELWWIKSLRYGMVSKCREMVILDVVQGILHRHRIVL